MKTEDLIGSLVADQSRRPGTVAGAVRYTLPLALLAAGLIFAYELNMRDDFTNALGSWRYLAKLAVAASIALFGSVMLFRISRPQHAVSTDIRLVGLALLPLVLAIIAEMLMLPTEAWGTGAMGFKPYYCLALVPTISAAPLVAGIVALRKGAPQSPTAAGAVAGFAAGGIGALIYALHCNNDSPFYVGLWYLGAILIVTAIGAGAGRMWLRW